MVKLISNELNITHDVIPIMWSVALMLWQSPGTWAITFLKEEIIQN